jgi:hypothetical protein
MIHYPDDNLTFDGPLMRDEKGDRVRRDGPPP